MSNKIEIIKDCYSDETWLNLYRHLEGQKSECLFAGRFRYRGHRGKASRFLRHLEDCVDLENITQEQLDACRVDWSREDARKRRH